MMEQIKVSSRHGDKDSHPLFRQPHPFWKEFLLTLNAIVTMPMWSMLLCLLAYIAIVDWASTVWLRTLLLMYIPYLLLDPKPSYNERAKHCSRYRSLANYKWFAQYFDMKLVKTCELDASQSYIMLYHPHGIIAVGANTALNTNGCSFEQTFPGLQRAGVTLTEAFWVPLFREWILYGLGFISASKSSLTRALAQHSIVLVPGGAAEALHAQPGKMQLCLKNRKGFVRLALETKSPLVPCIGFGENEIYNTTQPTKLQHALNKVFRVSFPCLKHFIPQRAIVTVVVGEPLILDMNEGEQNVDKCHALYLQHLQKFYDAEKEKYGYNHIELDII